ncbi:hypothetical protein GE09DRAFT_1265897 [Coniochaeta sp. 2T2.1]|nr:hypothetical protein GE09DRAFT_1265897 [Coniochaeta sp. 2T2.1]
MDHRFNTANMRTSASRRTGLPPAGSGSFQQSAGSDSGSNTSKTQEHFRISCPFRAKDPRIYNIRDHGKCALHVYHTMAEVRQHIKDYHVHADAPFYNPQLVKSMLSDKGRRGCHIGTQWEMLWNLLFPGDNVGPYEFRAPIEHFEFVDKADEKLKYIRGELQRILERAGKTFPGVLTVVDRIIRHFRGYLWHLLKESNKAATNIEFDNTSPKKDMTTRTKSPSNTHVTPANPNAVNANNSIGKHASAQRPGAQPNFHRTEPNTVNAQNPNGAYTQRPGAQHKFYPANPRVFNARNSIGTHTAAQHPGTQSSFHRPNTNLANAQDPNGPYAGAPHNFDPANPNANLGFH